jgi:uncharacterized Tic20 family protein
MNHKIPLSSRSIAAIIHISNLAIFSLFAFGFYLLFLPFYMQPIHFFYFQIPSAHDLIIGFPATILANTIILFQLKERANSFLSLAARGSINRTINTIIAVNLAIFILFMTISMNSHDSGIDLSTTERMEEEHEFFAMLDTAKNVLISITSFYSIDAAISAIFSLRGCRFKNRLIYPFIRD